LARRRRLLGPVDCNLDDYLNLGVLANDRMRVGRERHAELRHVSLQGGSTGLQVGIGGTLRVGR
jgi:hypothetical protein